MIVQKHIVRSQTLVRDSNGYEADGAHIVEVMGGTPESKLYSAITTAGVPQFGDPHPIIPDVIVTRVQASPEGSSPNNILVSVTYSVPDEEDTGELTGDEVSDGTITLSTSLSSEETWFDINGDFLKVVWRGGVIVTKYTSANVQRPQMNVTFKRTETALPRNEILNYLGKVNSTTWSGFPAKTWLCTGIDVDEEKGKFDVSYSFAYKEDDWQLEVIANLTQAQVDELPPDVESANGYAAFDVYRSIDFNSLGLSF